jgi:hypothetical protein
VPVIIPLPHPTIGWDWVVRVGFYAPKPAVVTLSAADTTVHARVRPGLHALFAGVRGSVHYVALTARGKGAQLCTNDVTVGLPGSQWQ